jgi:hypothetical protein
MRIELEEKEKEKKKKKVEQKNFKDYTILFIFIEN